MPETTDREREIVVGDTDAGEPYTLPVEELLTGRMFGTGKSGAGKSNTGSVIVEELRAQLDDARSTVQQLREEKEQLEKQATEGEGDSESLGDLVDHEAVQAAVDVAKDNCDRADRHVDRVLAVLASSDGGSLSVDEITPLMEGSETTVRQVCKALFEAGVVQRDASGRAHAYALDEEFLERRIEVSEQQLSG